MNENETTNTYINRVTSEEVKYLVNAYWSSKNTEIISCALQTFPEKLGYLGIYELLTIEVHEHDAKPTKKTITFFIKSLTPSCNDFEKLSFHDEFFFYNAVLPQMLEHYKGERWSAKCYLVKENAIVLEDLMSQGFKVMQGQLDVNHIKSASMALARFHACSIILEAKLGQYLNVLYPNSFKPKIFQKSNTISCKWLLTGTEVAVAIADVLKLNAESALAAYNLAIQKMKAKEGGTNVLCHDDLWLNNMMFSSEEQINCRLVDFQTACYSFYALDLSQLICMNLTKDVRNRIEKEVLKTYHSSFSEILRIHNIGEAKIVSLEQLLEDYEDVKIVGLVRAMQFWPIAFLNKEMVKEYSCDVARMNSYKYTSRKDFVLRVMETDKNYRNKMEEIVRDLIEYMEVFDK